MLDNSGSMRKNDPQFLTQQAVEEFVEHLPETARVAVLIFDQKVNLAVSLTPVSDQTRPKLLASLAQVNYHGQWTDSPAAMERAIYELRHRGRADADKSIVFMTDGIVDTGDKARDREKSRWLREDLAAEAAQAGIRIFGIAFTDAADYQLIQTLTRNTGGEYFRAFKAEDLQDVFNRISAAMVAPPTPTRRSEPVSPPPTDYKPLPLPPREEPARESKPELEIPTTPPVLQGPLDRSPLETALAAHEGPATQNSGQPAQTQSTAESTAGPAAGGGPDQWVATISAVAAVLSVGVGAAVLFKLRRRAAQPPDSMVSEPPKAFLNDLDNLTGQASHELSDKPTLIGRSAPKGEDGMNHVIVDETTVGRRHAIIEYKDYTYWIIDLNSVNGTYVNGRRITEQVPLKHGDRLRFHKAEFEFVMPEMFETGMTLMSHTVFAGQESNTHTQSPEPVDHDSTIQRPSKL